MASIPSLSELLDAKVRLDAVTSGGRSVTVAADAETLEQLAERLNVTSVQSMAAEVQVKRIRGGLHVVGEARAQITQPCVVTLDPVVQVIAEPVDRVFMPASQRPREPEPGSEVFVDLEGDDPPDYFEGPELDLSELLIETIALAIDPYPRAPDATVDAEVLERERAASSPFAALKGLTPKSGDDEDD
jgi:uncharacterized metal-binding protein YceD (DUF177 family)